MPGTRLGSDSECVHMCCKAPKRNRLDTTKRQVRARRECEPSKSGQRRAHTCAAIDTVSIDRQIDRAIENSRSSSYIVITLCGQRRHPPSTPGCSLISPQSTRQLENKPYTHRWRSRSRTPLLCAAHGLLALLHALPCACIAPVQKKQTSMLPLRAVRRRWPVLPLLPAYCSPLALVLRCEPG